MLQAPVDLTEHQIMQGKLLSPETTLLLQNEITLLEDILVSMTFHADPERRETAILQYVEAQAKRNALLELIQGSSEIRATLQELQSSVQQPQSPI